MKNISEMWIVNENMMNTPLVSYNKINILYNSLTKRRLGESNGVRNNNV